MSKKQETRNNAMLVGIRNAGFTLIELLVVVAIIGILTSVGILSYRSTNQKARDGRRQAELEQIRTALEIYRSDENVYPGALDDLVPSYMQTLPTDPKTPTYTYYYSPNTVDYRTYDLCAYSELGDSDDFCGGSLNCGDVCNYRVTNP